MILIKILRKIKSVVKKIDSKILGGKIRCLRSGIIEFDKIYLNSVLRKIYNTVKSKFGFNSNFFAGKKAVVLQEPVYDMILMQYNHRDYSLYAFYDLAVRLLAVEEYYGKNSIGYDLYKRMHTEGKNYGEGNYAEDYYAKMRKKNKIPTYGIYREYHSIEQFKRLIQSYEQNGYDASSPIMADNCLLNMNGSHRLTLAVYNNQEYITTEVHNLEFERRFNRDWFWKNSFTKKELMLLDTKIEEIIENCRSKIGDYYCILFPPAEKYFDEITDDIAEYDKENIILSGFQDYRWEVGDFIGFLRSVYFFDSILPNNFERKLFYILNASNIENLTVNFRILKIKIKYPMYRLKNDNGMPESMVTVRLKEMIRNRYRVKEEKFTKLYVGDYNHDVIIHSSDNYISNKAFRELLTVKKSLKSVFDNLNDFKYAIAASSNDKISSNFPINYYLTEDFDIFVHREDLIEISKLTYKEVLKVFADSKNVNVLEETCKTGKRIRVTYYGLTITMFDFMTSFEGIKQDWIDKSVDESILINNYKFLNIENEIVYRTNTFLRSPSKIYHRRFLTEHNKFLNAEHLKIAFEDFQRNKAVKLWQSL